jgi:beta-RFAP synthase
LHFGLLAPFAEAGRRFGGVGLMVEDPGITLSLEPAAAWSVEGPLARRAESLLQQLLACWPEGQGQPHKVCIHTAAPEHRGLGTGTQLALALARALAELLGLGPRSTEELALLAGRGKRSALGIHGFAQGGFLVDGGKPPDRDLAPLIARHAFPGSWRIVLVLPSGQPGLHGEAELQAFTHRPADALALTRELSRRVLLELLPALVEQDFGGFSEAIHAFNRLAGEPFSTAQAGVYAGAQVAALIQQIRELGVAGVGQSSWGPGVFALTRDEDQARWLRDRLRALRAFAADELLITRADNRGAWWEKSG